MSELRKVLLSLTVVFGLTACSDDPTTQQEPPVRDPSRVVISETTGTLNCGEVTLTRRPMRFCYEDLGGQATQAGADAKVLYYFHGLGGNERDIFEGGGRQILNLLQQLYGGEMPVVVSLSLGSQGVMGTDAPDIAAVGIPSLEASIASTKTWRRLVMGGSLGGHNSLRLAGEAPSAFTAVASLCPALATFNGHNQAEVDAYIARHEPLLDRGFLEQALTSYRADLPTTEIWHANNPFTLLEQGAYDSIPVFMSVGRQDQLGFVEGAREFKRQADLRGANVEYREVIGPHCAFDIPTLVDFIRARL